MLVSCGQQLNSTCLLCDCQGYTYHGIYKGLEIEIGIRAAVTLFANLWAEVKTVPKTVFLAPFSIYILNKYAIPISSPFIKYSPYLHCIYTQQVPSTHLFPLYKVFALFTLYIYSTSTQYPSLPPL